MKRPRPRAEVALALAVVLLSACGGRTSGTSALPPLPPPKAGKHFTHIVIVVQENRTFDNLFATFPGADGTTTGKTHDGRRRLTKGNLESQISPNNGYLYWISDWRGGNMDGFDLVPIGKIPGTYVYQYVDPAQIRPYWTLAQQYVLADHMFQTEGSGSFTAHQDLIAGGTAIDSTHSLIDFPSMPPWGCDSPAGTVTTLITRDEGYEFNEGPFPCSSIARCEIPRRGGNFVALLRPGSRKELRRRPLERVRCDQGGARRSAVGEKRRVAGDRHFHGYREWLASGGELGNSRLPKLRSPGRHVGHRPVMGGAARKCRREEFRLEQHGNLGRLG